MPGVEQEPKQTPPSQDDDLWQILREIQSYVAYYAAASLDRARIAIRSFAILAVLLLAAILVGGTIVVTASVLLCTGIAGGLGQLFGGMRWLGDLTTGLAILHILGIAGYYFVAGLIRSSRRQMMSEYENRRLKQRMDFGADVHERADQIRSTTQP